MAAMQPVSRRRLPTCVRIDGRPVWEPPILDYSELIDEEEDEKKREAVMKYTGRDPARTTTIMDTFTENRMLVM